MLAIDLTIIITFVEDEERVSSTQIFLDCNKW